MSLDTFEGLVDSMVAAGVGRAAAERYASARFGRSVKSIEMPSENDLREELEDAHVAAGDELMRAFGFEVVCFSQKKRAKVTPGIPDRRYYRRPRGSVPVLDWRGEFDHWTTGPAVMCWWEAKSETGRQRPDQRAFQEMVEACGEVYVLGKLEVLKQWLVDNGIAVRDGERFEPTSFPSSAA